MQNDQISLIKQLIQTRLDNLTLEEQANQSSKKIVELDQQSVGRLNRDEYGVCINCGDQIAFERLKLKPSVLKCLDCANI